MDIIFSLSFFDDLIDSGGRIGLDVVASCDSSVPKTKRAECGVGLLREGKQAIVENQASKSTK